MFSRDELSQKIGSLYSLFIALPLDEKAKQAFRKISDSVQALHPPTTYQSWETVHMTLRFFDRIPTSDLSDYLNRFQAISQENAPFLIEVEGYGYFGRPNERKVLWLKVKQNESLIKLNNSLEKYWPEGRPFTPHITLGRIKDPRLFARFESKIDTLLKSICFSFQINRLRLYGAEGDKRQITLIDFTFATPAQS